MTEANRKAPLHRLDTTIDAARAALVALRRRSATGRPPSGRSGTDAAAARDRPTARRTRPAG